jgi:hypothetical protein
LQQLLEDGAALLFQIGEGLRHGVLSLRIS